MHFGLVRSLFCSLCWSKLFDKCMCIYMWLMTLRRRRSFACRTMKQLNKSLRRRQFDVSRENEVWFCVLKVVWDDIRQNQCSTQNTRENCLKETNYKWEFDEHCQQFLFSMSSSNVRMCVCFSQISLNSVRFSLDSLNALENSCNTRSKFPRQRDERCLNSTNR